jgi:RNase P/RNase MRP subunit p29
MMQYIAVPSLKITLPNFYHPEDNRRIKFKVKDEMIKQDQHLATHVPDGIVYLRQTVLTYNPTNFKYYCWYRFERDNFIWANDGESVLLPSERLVVTKGKEIMIPKLPSEFVIRTKSGIQTFKTRGRELNIYFSRKPFIPIKISVPYFPRELTFNTKGELILVEGEKLIDVK